MKAVVWLVSRVLLVLGLAVIAVLLKNSIAPAAEATALYTITDLGSSSAPLEDNSTKQRAATYPLTVTAINNVGQVVGTSLTPEGYRAFTWRGGVKIDLNHLIPPSAQWQLEQALAINDAGQILGQGRLNGQPHHFLLTPIAQTLRA